MNESIFHKQINWQDGMKINKSHFLESDFYHINQHNLSRSFLLTENNFGLLPSADKTKPSFDIHLILEGGNVVVKKFKFGVLMLNGTFFQIDSDELNSMMVDTDIIKTKFIYSDYGEQDFYLIFKVNPYKGISFGSYLSEDLPIRRPHLIPFFEFHLIPEKKIKGDFFSEDFFAIAKFSVISNQIVIDPDYIPPVTSLVSHDLLVRFKNQSYDTLLIIEQCLIEIAKKYGKMNAETFRDTLLLLSNNLLCSISRIKFELKHNLLYQPPIELIIRIKELANILNSTLLMRTEIGKDRFLNEVNKILGSGKFQFEEMLKQMVLLEYRHYNISASIAMTKEFLDHISRILKSLSEYEKTKKPIDILIKR